MFLRDRIKSWTSRIPRPRGIAVPSFVSAAGNKLGGLFVFPTNEDHEKRDAILLSGVLATFALCELALYLPLYGCLALLVLLVGGCSASFYFDYHQKLTTAVAAVVIGYTTLIQPVVGMFFGPLALAGLAVSFYWRKLARGKFGFGLLLAGITTALVALVSFAASFFVYDWSYLQAIPAIHPFTVHAWNLSPFAYVVLATLLVVYCVQRMKSSDSLVYRLAPGFSAIGFALLYPMHEAVPGSILSQITVGDVVEWLFVAGAFITAFCRPGLLRLGGIAVGTLFCLAFMLFQVSNWAYMTAVGMSMPTAMTSAAPATTNGHTMPLIVGQSSCPQGNTTPLTVTGPVSLSLNGSHFDYQCALHYTSWVGTDPILSAIPGSTLDVIRVDAGTKSGETREVHGRFYFGEDSPYYRAAVMIRHPGSTMGDYSYTTEVGGSELKLAVSYSQTRLWWGAMVPAVGGSVVESQSGGFADYTVGEAAQDFPDFFQVPEEIVKLRSRAWAAYRNVFASLWSPDEVSEVDTGVPGKPSQPGNHPPFALGLKDGPAYFMGLEPQGNNGTAMSYYMFFDARYGLAKIMDVSQAPTKLKGLRDIEHLAPSVSPGNNGLFGIEPIPTITDDGRCFYTVSIMGPNAEARNKDFQGVVVFTASGDKVSNTVLDTTDKVNAEIANFPAVKCGQHAGN
jgi:hypothetical protein